MSTATESPPGFFVTGTGVTFFDYTDPDSNAFRLTGIRAITGMTAQTSRYGEVGRYVMTDADGSPSCGYLDFALPGPGDPPRSNPIGHVPPPLPARRLLDTIERLRHEAVGVVPLVLEEGRERREWLAFARTHPSVADRLAALVPNLEPPARPETKIPLGGIFMQQRFPGPAKVQLDPAALEPLLLDHANHPDLAPVELDEERLFLHGLEPLEIRNGFWFQARAGVIRHEYEVDPTTSDRARTSFTLPGARLWYVIETALKLGVTLATVETH